MKCPNCGEEIPYLINEYIEEVMVYEVIPDTNGKILYFRVGSKPVSDSMSITNIPEINLSIVLNAKLCYSIMRKMLKHS